MSKQTAVDTLIEILVQECGFDNETETAQRFILLAKQMEKEQIEKSYTLGREQWQKYEWDNSNYENDVEIPTPRKYYNETYGGQNE